MTKDEAIQILSTRDWSGMLCGYTSGYTEALDMAIEALSGDKISRAELFNRLAVIKSPAEANEYKAEVYKIINEM